MSETCEHKNPLKHPGTSQGERVIAALDPQNVELHGLTEKDWLEFAYNYARLVNYFKDDDPDQISGDWQYFFDPGKDAESLLKQYGDGDTEPYMTLFISFLKLLTYPQQSLNEIPKRHLDFYYKEVLRIGKKPVQPDSVHILFELAKNASDEFLDTGITLNAGKDSNGAPLIYETTTPLVVNHAKIASLKSVFVDKKGESEILRYAPEPISADGEGEEIEDGQNWPAFGNPDWPEANLSFYIASDLLQMKEGTRQISLKFELSKSITLAKNRIRAFVTGEDDWIEISTISSGSKTSQYNFILDLTIDPETDPVTAYDEETHETGLSTTKPVLKLVFLEPEDYGLLKNTDIQKLRLEVNVQGAKALELKNELGNIDPEKPFMPFGSQPKVGSKLTVRYPELSGKPVSIVEFGMEWLNTPSNFSEHYSHYLDEIKKQKEKYAANSSNYGSYMVVYNYKDPSEIEHEALLLGAYITKNWFSMTGPPPDDLKPSFKAQLESPYNSSVSEYGLFSNLPQARIETTGSTRKVSDPKMSIILTESFYHDLYSKIYVNSVLTTPEETAADLPNEPYTPLLDQLTLNYTAHENVTFSASPGDKSSSIMFHQHPFGTKRAMGTGIGMLPDYSFSEFYIGLEELEAGSNISLLFQVAEGTEDPLLGSFEEGEIEWWALSENEWIKIGKKDFARNQTNNFLRSGIVELTQPKEATRDNTLLPGGLHWIRIRLKKHPDSVSRFINIHAQAAEALFNNRENTTEHLNHGLPAETIGKMVNTRAGIKSVLQPYQGFGGAPEESDNNYYRRVSERLRHKNRAVSIWDYEHLVLEKFPELYKVKCLNHSFWDGSSLDEMSPGNVTMVLIPKLAEDNTEFRLKPRVSRDFIDRVEAFVNGQSSVHAQIQAVNPNYEPVRFEFGVEFNNGLDFNYHKKRVMEDLKRMIAPWVFDDEASIEFGGSFSEYQVVHYIENLSYIDYITDFKMFHKPLNGSYTQKPIAEPSIPMAILIPVFDEEKINETRACD